jgi:phage shock protein E
MTRSSMDHRASARLMTGLLAVVLVACTAPADDSKQAPDPKSVAADELAERIKLSQAPLILDVRSEKEYAEGHIPGALNIPHDQLGDRLSEIDVAANEEIVVHCKSGYRAGIAEDILIEAEYTNVRDLDGHMDGWQSGGYPIESP